VGKVNYTRVVGCNSEVQQGYDYVTTLKNND